jgi:prepilin peptidase CpaA
MLYEIIILTLFPVSMAFAGFIDMLSYTIPNKLSLLLVAAFFVMVPFTGMGLEETGMHLAAGAGMLVVGIFFFAMGWMGGADGKIMAVTSLWLGPELLGMYIIIASMIGGVLGLMLIYFRRIVLLPSILHKQQWIMRLHDSKNGLPYGVPLAISALFLYPDTVWVQSLAN